MYHLKFSIGRWRELFAVTFRRKLLFHIQFLDCHTVNLLPRRNAHN